MTVGRPERFVGDAGFELTKLGPYYHKRPSADGYTFEGVTTKEPRIMVRPHPRPLVPTGADLARPA